MHPEFLRKYCDFLIKNPEYKFCYARVAAKHEDALEKEPCEIWYRHIEDGKPDELFKDLIEQKNVPPLAFYMMETKAFFDVVELPLFISKGGQNWQILLPMAYHYKCGYMNDVLATCVMRDASHSRAKSDASDRQDALKRIQFNTISRIAMPDGEKAFYYDKITRKYLNAAPGNYTVKLFNFIPFLNIRRKKEEAVLRLFDLLPVAVIRERACLPPPPPKLRSCVRLYFDMYPNFGDMLNIELIKFFGLTVKSAEKFDADAIFIGSLLSRFTEGKKRFFPRTVKVWGAGFGRPPVGKRETLRRPLELHAVRGEISLERLRKIADGELSTTTLN